MQCAAILCIIIIFYLLFLTVDHFVDDHLETVSHNIVAEKFFDENVEVYVINMLYDKNRLEFMTEQFTNQKIKFTVVTAPNINRVDKKFLDAWPTMYGDRYKGTKGLYLSNLKAMKMGVEQRKSWVCIFEDDVRISKNFKEKVYKTLKTYPDVDVFNLDKNLFRNNFTSYLTMQIFSTLGHTGTNLFKRDALPAIIKELTYSTSRHLKNFGKPAIFDQYLYWLLLRMGLKFRVVPTNKKDYFNSTIETSTKKRGRVPFTAS